MFFSRPLCCIFSFRQFRCSRLYFFSSIFNAGIAAWRFACQSLRCHSISLDFLHCFSCLHIIFVFGGTERLASIRQCNRFCCTDTCAKYVSTHKNNKGCVPVPPALHLEARRWTRDAVAAYAKKADVSHVVKDCARKLCTHAASINRQSTQVEQIAIQHNAEMR